MMTAPQGASSSADITIQEVYEFLSDLPGQETPRGACATAALSRNSSMDSVHASLVAQAAAQQLSGGVGASPMIVPVSVVSSSEPSFDMGGLGGSSSSGGGTGDTSGDASGASGDVGGGGDDDDAPSISAAGASCAGSTVAAATGSPG